MSSANRRPFHIRAPKLLLPFLAAVLVVMMAAGPASAPAQPVKKLVRKNKRKIKHNKKKIKQNKSKVEAERRPRLPQDRQVIAKVLQEISDGGTKGPKGDQGPKGAEGCEG